MAGSRPQSHGDAISMEKQFRLLLYVFTNSNNNMDN